MRNDIDSPHKEVAATVMEGQSLPNYGAWLMKLQEEMFEFYY